MGSLTPFELVNIIRKYGLEKPNVVYRELENETVFIEGKINDRIEYKYNIKDNVLSLIGDIPFELQGYCRKIALDSIKLNKEQNDSLLAVLGSVGYFKDTYCQQVWAGFGMIAQMDGLFCLDVKSKIEFMKVLEVILKGYSYYKLSDKVIEREYLLYILTLKEICVGASITEWIGCYNKKVLKSICSSQAVPLAGKTDRLSVCMLKGALDGFEKSVNFFNETSYDDVEAILSNEDNDFTFDSKYKNSPCNDLMSFNFTMNLKNGRMIKFSRFDDFKFEIVYRQKGYSLSYTNGCINFKEGRNVAYKIEFDKIDRYDDEYIEEITRKINEVSECVNKLVRGKESKEKKLL